MQVMASQISSWRVLLSVGGPDFVRTARTRCRVLGLEAVFHGCPARGDLGQCSCEFSHSAGWGGAGCTHPTLEVEHRTVMGVKGKLRGR